MNKLIEYLLENPIRTEKWADLAIKFDINPNQSNKHRRGDSARILWERFLKRISNSGQDLEVVKQTFKNGELLFETKKKSSFRIT